MTLRKKKETFILKIRDKYQDTYNKDKVIQGISLAIDCLIENEATQEDKPIIFVSYGDENKHAAKLLKELCVEHYSSTSSELFDYEMLNLPNSSAEDALLKLVEICRCRTSLFYWADAISWFKTLPSNTMHVINFNGSKVIRGVNQQDRESITIKKKSFNTNPLNEEHFGLINLHKSISDSIDGSLSDLFYEEALGLIIRPIPAPTGYKYNNPITIDSPNWQKEACVAIRRYQGKECQDGFKWDTSNNAWENVVVYPILEDILMIDSQEIRECLIGQVTMVTPENADTYLSTAWIHPFYRRRGKLSKIWNELINIYGKFEVEEPNSNMQSFIAKKLISK
ncbi:hypothetical protein [Neptunicella marina]|uniref:Uncharacterized protein n=1 Tax=Neptunicella marina TaxID=2125989 RepID=A0A8J6M1X1_9ALTE|nr:hypothetical protein [Neptunicella marina]MBC3765817.1 hypothetical protein [Neptunicella marina]